MMILAKVIKITERRLILRDLIIYITIKAWQAAFQMAPNDPHLLVATSLCNTFPGTTD